MRHVGRGLLRNPESAPPLRPRRHRTIAPAEPSSAKTSQRLLRLLYRWSHQRRCRRYFIESPEVSSAAPPLFRRLEKRLPRPRAPPRCRKRNPPPKSSPCARAIGPAHRPGGAFLRAILSNAARAVVDAVHARDDASRTWDVHMLLVARSRRMCCSLVCKESLKAGSSFASIDTPTMRPGMARLYLSCVAR